jgi:hypothetical protein
MSATWSFLPWLRTGMAAGLRGAPGGPRAAVEVTLVVDAAGDRRPVTAPLALHGPGEVAGIDPRVVIRVAPKPGEVDAEPSELPMIELDQPDFPWRHTPAGADARQRLAPWLVLVVLAADEIGDEAPAGADGRLPAVTVPTVALPRLDQSWAWAHVQVDGFDPDTENLSRVVQTQPRRVRARLLAPRHLRPHTGYTAMLVPAFERGRRAGLREPLGDEVDGLAPAWAPGVAAVRLPVYYRWSFATGEQGDFESLARRLRARAVGGEVGRRDLDVAAPDPALPAAASGPLAMDGALVSPASASPAPWAEGERAAFVTALAGLLNLPADALAAEGVERTVTPPLWGRWHAATDRLDPAPGATPVWFHELNGDPRLRATAGLGAEVVRRHDQQLMAAAWDQVEGVIAANEALRRAQLAREAAAKLHANHLARLDLDTFMQVVAPLHARLRASATTVHAALRASPIPDGALDGQLRRVRRPAGATSRRLRRAGRALAASPRGLLARLNVGEVRPRPPVATPPTMVAPARLVPEQPLRPAVPMVVDERRRRERVLAGTLTREEAARITPPPDWRPGVAAEVLDQPDLPGHRPLPVGGDPRVDLATARAVARFRTAFEELVDEVNTPPPPGPELHPADLAGLGETLLARMDPRVTIPAGLGHRLGLADWVTWAAEDPLEPIMVAPEIDRPMYEPLAELGQDWLLPGAGRIEPDTVTLVVTNQRFVEAYMAGLSHELARELLYHEYPTDQRGTYFRQFWDSRGHVADDGEAGGAERLRDIERIHRWEEALPLGSNPGRTPTPREGNIVLLIKGELLRRYPNTIVSAIRAARFHGQLTLGGPELFPVFQGRLEPDISFFGFDLLPSEARGTGISVNQGWFFVLAEHPGEPRFGLDADNGEYGAKPTAWADLNWAHLAASGADLDALGAIDLDADLPDTSAVVPGPGDPPLAWHADHGPGPAGANASDLAWITLQRPFRVAIHAVDMLPPEAEA